MSGPRYSIIPGGAITDPSLEPRDLQVLCLLGCHIDKSGWCRRSQVKMAGQLNCGRSSVQRSLDRLVEAGWVEKKRPPRVNQEGQPSNSYMYRVILDRDDFTAALSGDDCEIDASDASDSYAETALLGEGKNPPVGRGCPAIRGHGVPTHTWAPKNVPLERSAAADARVSSDLAFGLAEQLLVIAGHDPAFWPPAWCGAQMRVQTWLANGWSQEIILAAAQGVMAKRRGKPPPNSVQFFEKAIAEEVARQATPLPQVGQASKSTVNEHGKTSDLLAAADRLIQFTRGLEQASCPGDELRSGAGAVDVRLLPPRRG